MVTVLEGGTHATTGAFVYLRHKTIRHPVPTNRSVVILHSRNKVPSCQSVRASGDSTSRFCDVHHLTSAKSVLRFCSREWLLINERQPMFPDAPTAIDRCFDLAEHLALRASLLVFLLLALYRLIEREWNRKDASPDTVERRRRPGRRAGTDPNGSSKAGHGPHPPENRDW
jgi:hypothetical protein